MKTEIKPDLFSQVLFGFGRMEIDQTITGFPNDFFTSEITLLRDDYLLVTLGLIYVL